MKKRANTYKALFLVLVFSLNIVVGFACSLGFKFSFNKPHHAAPATEGKGHSHQHSHGHGISHTHHHEHSPADAPAEDNSKEEECCSQSVVKLATVDKLVAATSKVPVLPVILLSPLQSIFTITEYSYLLPSPLVLYPPGRSWPPAYHTDLRIVIQSFQI